MRPTDGCAALAAPHRPGGLLSRPGGLLSTFTEDVNDRPRICCAPLLGDAARSGRIAITASASRGRRGNSQAQWRSRCCVAYDVVTSEGSAIKPKMVHSLAQRQRWRSNFGATRQPVPLFHTTGRLDAAALRAWAVSSSWSARSRTSCGRFSRVVKLSMTCAPLASRRGHGEGLVHLAAPVHRLRRFVAEAHHRQDPRATAATCHHRSTPWARFGIGGTTNRPG
jgi:hypothetical protein